MNCISPIDGRYKEITSELSKFFSEFSFFKYRLFVEIQYFCHLIPVLPELHELKDQKTTLIRQDSRWR